MPWVKDVTSLKPRIVYIAPPELAPMKRIIYDPRPSASTRPWAVEYAYIDHEGATVAFIERLMGLV